MQHRDRIILKKIIDEVDIVVNAMDGKDFKTFDSDELFKRGICMTVINIGELVKNLSQDFRKQHNAIPWKNIAGFRDIAAHKYATLDMYDVFDTVSKDFPELKENILQLLKDET